MADGLMLSRQCLPCRNHTDLKINHKFNIESLHLKFVHSICIKLNCKSNQNLKKKKKRSTSLPYKKYELGTSVTELTNSFSLVTILF